MRAWRVAEARVPRTRLGNRASMSLDALGHSRIITSHRGGAALYLTKQQALAPRNLRRRSSAAIKTGNPAAGRPHAKMCDSPKIKTATPTKKKPEDDEEEEKAPLTPSQRKRSEEEIILSAPASAQSAKSKESPEKEPKSKKQKRQSEKLKCISSPKPIGI